jgi:hypothetical protein
MNDIIQDINSKQELIISQKLAKNKIKNDYEKSKSDIKRQAKIDKKSIKRSLIDQIKNTLLKKKKRFSRPSTPLNPCTDATESSLLNASHQREKKVRFDV